MNAKIIASLAFTSMFSLSTLLSPAHAEEQEKALNFGIISTESQQNLKPQWTPFLPVSYTHLAGVAPFNGRFAVSFMVTPVIKPTTATTIR